MESVENELSHSALEAKLKLLFLFSAHENYSGANRLKILPHLAALSLVSVLLFSGQSRLVFFFYSIRRLTFCALHFDESF